MVVVGVAAEVAGNTHTYARVAVLLTAVGGYRRTVTQVLCAYV